MFFSFDYPAYMEIELEADDEAHMVAMYTR
jgi:hypothetical protein